jgi:tRNA 2-thiouridine synthesizing protein E
VGLLEHAIERTAVTHFTPNVSAGQRTKEFRKMITREIAGKTVHFDGQGFMSDPNEWDNEIAAVLAGEIGINPLTIKHWQVIEFCRSDFQEKGQPPTLRRITKVGGVSTKELYALFPKGPAKKVAYVAGLGKPSGCI